MFKKALIAGAAAVLIGAGGLAATATSASAHSYGSGYVAGNGFFFGFGYAPKYQPYRGPVHRYQPAKRQVCTPKYKTVRAWQPYRGWVSYKVYDGKVCRWQPVYNKW